MLSLQGTPTCRHLTHATDRSHHNQELYSNDRWDDLIDLFIQTHNALLSIPNKPLLNIALSAGLSALKTPSCHSKSKNGSSSSIVTAHASSSCPICSKELNSLARNVPYALHTSSKVDHDTIILPNSRVYGRAALVTYAKKIGLPDGMVKDMVTGEIFPLDEVEKVFLS